MRSDSTSRAVYFDRAHGQSRWGETGYPPRRLDTTFAGLATLLRECELVPEAGVAQLSPDLLSSHRMLVVPPPVGSFKPLHFFGGEWHRTEDSYFSRDELDALLSFIEDGGRLLGSAYRFGDPFTGTNVGELAASLGVLLNADAVIDLAVVDRYHPLYTTFQAGREQIVAPWAAEGVQRTVWRPTTSFTVLPRSAAFVVVMSPPTCVRLNWGTLSPDYQSAALCVAGAFGRGRFVLFGGPHAIESSDFGLLSTGDNMQFARNVLSWLLAEPAVASPAEGNRPTPDGDQYTNARLDEVQSLWRKVDESETPAEKGKAFESFARFFMEDCGIFRLGAKNAWDSDRGSELDLVFECLCSKPLWSGSNGLVPVECKNHTAPVQAADVSRFVDKLVTVGSMIGVFFGRSFSKAARAATHNARLAHKATVGLISDSEIEPYVRGIAPAQKVLETSIITSRIR